MPQRNPEDLPWKDAPADDDTFDADPEPDPAEVVGDEDDEAQRDLAAHRAPDPYHQDTLDERLAEEEPDAELVGSPAAETGELQTPQGDDEVVERGEADPDRDVDEPGAEDAAIHVRRRV